VLDTQLIQDGMGEKLSSVLKSLSAFITGFVIAFVRGWKLSLVMFASIPALVIVGAVAMGSIKRYQQISQDVYAHAGAIAEQAFSGIRTVFAFSLQGRFKELYDAKLGDSLKADTRKGIAFGVSIGSIFGMIYMVYALAFWYGSRLVIRGEISGSTVLVVFMAMLIGTTSLIMLPQPSIAIAQACASAYRIFAVIDRVPEIDSSKKDGIKKSHLEGTIEFKNVDFHYPTRPDIPILKNLSLSIKPGQRIAFVGPSGSGKSTTVALVQRLYDVVGGSVSIDGQNIKDYNLHWLREQIGLVGQEPVLFNMSIRQNILMGAKDAITEERFIEVCKMANCHNFVSSLPDGYDTGVGEYGGMLSGGQKQRIAIARALINNPRILLLDEATSALDTASERIVQRALDAASRNRTTITIAHRLSTIRHSDLIVVIDKGELVEQGTHESLYAMGGIYYTLVEKQRIAMNESDEAKEEKKEEAEIEVVKLASPAHVAIKVENAGGLLSVPNAHTMVEMANARRKAEKKDIKNLAHSRSYTMDVVRKLRSNWGLLSVGIIAACIAGAVNPIFAWLLGKEIVVLINPDTSKIAPGPMEGANLYAFLFAIIGFANFFGFGIQWSLSEIVGARLTRVLRNEMFASLLRQEVGFYDAPGHTVGALTGRLAKDTSDATLLVSKAWGEVIQFFTAVGVGLALAFSTAANITGIIIALVPFSVFAQYYRRKVMMGHETATRMAYEEASESASEAIKAIRTVVALTRENWFVERYSASLEQPHHLGVSKSFRDSIGVALQGSTGQFINALAFYAGLRLIQGGHVSFSDMFVTLMVAIVSTQALGRAAMFTISLHKGKIGASKTFEFVERVSTIDPEKDGYVPPDFNPSFEFKNVSFSYPTRPHQPIFGGEFNLQGYPNQTLALVGPSGCGKSTTIAMLQRWYDCTGGSVSVGGHNVQEYQLTRGLRVNTALVGQEPVLFDTTIGKNIAWGTDREDITLDEIIETAKTANIHTFISSLPDGYNTRVGDKGSQLSGGQKQRIAIARALIRKPKILLLDEATSALDSESEKIVQMAIDKASAGRTTITIAHRLSTVQNADQIAVVRDGKIVEMGKHFELLAYNGLYADLVRQQSLDVDK
jgi:ABC-type multidrug transport system fused ATPase/permease subunit